MIKWIQMRIIQGLSRAAGSSSLDLHPVKICGHFGPEGDTDIVLDVLEALQ